MVAYRFPRTRFNALFNAFRSVASNNTVHIHQL
jgi:hypothetical protein